MEGEKWYCAARAEGSRTRIVSIPSGNERRTHAEDGVGIQILVLIPKHVCYQSLVS
jgi:hypothetical protein